MAKRSLGHYDAAHNTIVVSRVFDRPSSPRYAIEYLLYHEMLHLKHPVRMRGLRRCVHSREFKADEAQFSATGRGDGVYQAAVEKALGRDAELMVSGVKVAVLDFTRTSFRSFPRRQPLDRVRNVMKRGDKRTRRHT